MNSKIPVGSKIVLATFGTFGDVNPFIALAIELKRRAMVPIIAAAETYRTAIEAEAIAFHRMRPNVDEVAARLGMNQRQMARAIARHPEFLLKKIVLPSLGESYDDAMTIIRNADVVVTNSVAYAAKLAAEKCAVPHFGVAMQPFVFLSIWDPPIVATMPRLSAWIYRRGRAWTRTYFALGRWVARGWAKPIEKLRREIGLAPDKCSPLFEGQFGEGAIALFSPLFGAAQSDYPAHTCIAGFTFYDGPASTLSHDVLEFLAAGTPPIVFTLGTSVVHDAEHFVRESLAAMQMLDERAIFVLDDEQAQRWASHATKSILITRYAPYSKLFPHAKIIVHHGGVGTTAHALRAGRLQLVVPYLVDQPDNAARVVRMGVGQSLALKHYRAACVCAQLRKLMRDHDGMQRAASIGASIARENGAAVAADFIIAAGSNADSSPRCAQ